MKKFFAVFAFLGYASSCMAQQTPGGGVTSSDLEKWRQEFKSDVDTKAPSTARPDPSTVNSLNTLDGWLQSTDDIRTFRSWNRDDDVVQALIPLAAGSYSETRLPATFILGNVVDNTNVCRVLDYLRKNPGIEPNGRYNLLQVVLQVSDYAFDDTAGWIEQTAADLEKQLGKGTDNGKTLLLLKRIKSQLQNRSLGKADRLEILSPERFAGCASLLGEPKDPADVSGELPSSMGQLTTADIQEAMFSSDRRRFAEHLVDLYNDPGNRQLVHALASAIIPQGENPEMRYRVNLYIALTFSLLPGGVIEDANDAAALKSLKGSAEMKDATFADNVQRALAKQNIP